MSQAARLVVLVSGEGTNLQALLDACADEAYGVRVAAVGADRDDVRGLERAAVAGVPTFVVPLAPGDDRDAWNRTLADHVASYEPHLVVMAGFMKIVSPEFLKQFPDRVVNTHPALLPAFPGVDAVRQALAYGAKLTGVTVHLVDQGVDTGPVVAQAPVPVLDGDDEQSLHARIKLVERVLLVEAVGRMMRDGFDVDGRQVTLA